MTPSSDHADHASQQTDFFQAVESDTSQRELAELCNALYERELQFLSAHGPKQINLLRRRLAGLSHHVNRTARFLVSRTTPLALDEHNASWQAKQPAKSPARNADSDVCAQWLEKHAKVGLVIPVRVQEFDNEHIELDSIDKVQLENQTLHINKFGWFDFNGNSLEEARFAPRLINLVKPTKTIVTSACCGHSWNHKGKTLPRRLSIREMLLVSTLDWRHFSAAKMPPKF